MLKNSNHPVRPSRRQFICGSLIAVTCSFSPLAFPQTAPYPSKPVRIVVPFAAGGPNDVMARVLAQQLTANTGTSFVVENKAGAGGVIGTDAVAKAAPDGYTLAFISAPFTMSPALQSKMPYDTTRDFAPITQVAQSPMVFMVPSTSAFKSVQELIDFALKNPSKLNYGTGGIGSTPHLTTELFAANYGIKLTHVPYKGGGESIKALMAGEIDFLIDSITSTDAAIASGRVKPLAVGQERRLAKLPHVPTLKEAGIEKFAASHWVGIVTPASTPNPVQTALHSLVTRALAAPELKQKFQDLGASPIGNASADFGKFIADEVSNWQRIVKAANISAQ